MTGPSDERHVYIYKLNEFQPPRQRGFALLFTCRRPCRLFSALARLFHRLFFIILFCLLKRPASLSSDLVSFSGIFNLTPTFWRAKEEEEEERKECRIYDGCVEAPCEVREFLFYYLRPCENEREERERERERESVSKRVKNYYGN